MTKVVIVNVRGEEVTIAEHEVRVYAMEPRRCFVCAPKTLAFDALCQLLTAGWTPGTAWELGEAPDDGPNPTDCPHEPDRLHYALRWAARH